MDNIYEPPKSDVTTSDKVTTSSRFGRKNYYQTFLALVASLILLSTIFMATSNNINGWVDFKAYFYTLPKIIAVSVIPAFITWVMNLNQWYWSILIGCIAGFTSAAILIQVIYK